MVGQVKGGKKITFKGQLLLGKGPHDCSVCSTHMWHKDLVLWKIAWQVVAHLQIF